jgi:hypothetical protein
LDDNGNVMAGSYAGRTSNDGIIKRYIKVPLVLVLGANNRAYEASQTTVSSHPNGYADGITAGNTGTGSYSKVTQDMIPFNFDILGSYNIQLYKSDGTEIPFGETGGDWIPDKETGIITFYQYDNVTNVNADNPPLFSFYRYVGDKGLANVGGGGGATGVITGTTGTFTGDLQIDPNTCPSTDLTSSQFTKFLMFGETGCTGSWRVGVQGPSELSNPFSTRLTMQQYNGSEWVTKGRLNGA